MAEYTKEELADAIAKANAKYATKSGGSAAPMGGSAALDKGLKSAADAINPFTNALKSGGDAAKSGLDTLQQSILKGMDAWQSLSKSGAGFNNDIIGMTVAAAGTRMPLADFASVIKDNASNFAGLGGNVTRGAEAFAKLSKEMFDSGAADSLKQLGYTNKDLNEVLALQMGTIRSSMRDDKASREAAIQSAAELANEMDLMAKMTGRTREEQQEAMKKAQGDAAVEAKLRLIGIKEGPEAEAKARKEYLKQFNEAEAQGRGQMFKEVFATGQVMSKEAATQRALDGKAAEATSKAALATAKGDGEAASKYNADARAETIKLNQDESRLRLATLGKAGGTVSESIGATMMNKTNRADYDATQKIKQEKGFENASEAELLAESKRRAQEAQRGEDKDGKKVSGATDAAVQFGNRMGDVNSALTKGLLDPLNKEIGPGLSTFAKTYLSGDNFGGTNKRIAPAVEDAAKKGYEKGTKPAESPYNQGVKGGTGPGGALLGGVEDVGGLVGVGGRAFRKGIDAINEKGVPKHGQGGIINGPELAVIAEEGPEAVIPLDKLKDFMPTAGGIDLSKISKDISTTVSGGGSSTVKVPDMSEMTKKFEDSFSSFNTEFEDVLAQSSEDIADAMGGSKASAAQAKIDEAIAEKQKALDKIVFMMNEVSDEDFDQSAWDDAIAERDAAQAKLDKVIEDSMSDLASGLDEFSDGWEESIDKVSNDISDTVPYDEFAGLDKAIEDQKAMNDAATMDMFYDSGPAMKDVVAGSSPTSAQGRGITADSITLGPNGMPIMKPKSTAAAAPDKKKEEEFKKIGEEQGAEAEAAARQKASKDAGKDGSKEGEKKGGSNDKAATLDDVVKSLNALNTKMGQLISVNEEGHKSTAKAAKSNSANLYNK